jgi:hypothetical protein
MKSTTRQRKRMKSCALWGIVLHDAFDEEQEWEEVVNGNIDMS